MVHFNSLLPLLKSSVLRFIDLSLPLTDEALHRRSAEGIASLVLLALVNRLIFHGLV